MEVYLYSWRLPKQGLTTEYTIKQIETHICSEDELGFTNDSEASRFYPAAPEMERDIKRMIGNWHCLDPT